MKVSQCGPTDVVFSHHDDETGQQLHFAISHILAWIEKEKPHIHTIDVEPEFGRYCMKYRGIETHRLEALRNVDERRDPVIFVLLDDGTHLLIDGSHRYCVAALKRRAYLRAYILEPDQWKPFIIEGIPALPKEAILGGWSGL